MTFLRVAVETSNPLSDTRSGRLGKSSPFAANIEKFDFPEDIADLACEAEGNGCGVFDALRAIAEVSEDELDELLHSVFDEQSTTLSVLYPKKQKNDQGGF